MPPVGLAWRANREGQGRKSRLELTGSGGGGELWWRWRQAARGCPSPPPTTQGAFNGTTQPHCAHPKRQVCNCGLARWQRKCPIAEPWARASLQLQKRTAPACSCAHLQLRMIAVARDCSRVHGGAESTAALRATLCKADPARPTNATIEQHPLLLRSGWGLGALNAPAAPRLTRHR